MRKKLGGPRKDPDHPTRTAKYYKRRPAPVGENPERFVSRPTKAEKAGAPRRFATSQLRLMAFADNYRRTFSARKAAIAAGYSETSAATTGGQLLRDGRVQELLAKYALDAQAATTVRVGEILQALSEIAYVDPAQCFEQTIHPTTKIVTLRLRDVTELPLEVRRTIASFKVVKKNLTSGDGFIDTVIEVKFWPKVKSLELLAQHKGMLTQKADEQVTDRQIEKMSDEELAKTLDDAREKWAKHLAARERTQLALVPKT